MTNTEPWTILRLLNWTTDYLRDHESESPRLDAELLLAFANKCRREDLYLRFESEVDDDVRSQFRALVKQRAEGAPVAYLVGRREFYKLSFRVTPDVLIPRPETEHIIVELLERYTKPADGKEVRVVDVGTGSGVLAICAAKYAEGSTVDAIDISEAALDVARENAEEIGVADRITFHTGDLLEPVSGPFDFVLSNPPYVSQAEYDELDGGVKDFEPQTALLAGPGGEDIIARLVPQAAEKLAPGGWLMFEMSPMIASACRRLVEDEPRFGNPVVVPDFARHARLVLAQRK